MTFQEFWKNKNNQKLMAKYRTCLLDVYGNEVDYESQQDDWSNEVFYQKVQEGALPELVAEEIAIEIRQLKLIMKQRRKEVLR